MAPHLLNQAGVNVSSLLLDQFVELARARSYGRLDVGEVLSLLSLCCSFLDQSETLLAQFRLGSVRRSFSELSMRRCLDYPDELATGFVRQFILQASFEGVLVLCGPLLDFVHTAIALS